VNFGQNSFSGIIFEACSLVGNVTVQPKISIKVTHLLEIGSCVARSLCHIIKLLVVLGSEIDTRQKD